MKGIWAGDPAGIREYNQIMARIEAKLDVLASGSAAPADALTPTSIYQRHGDVGVISIDGYLMPGEATAIHQAFGMQGYDNIKSALVEGIADKNAKSLMLYVNSGGGSVDGVRAAHQFISNVGQVKPLTAYTNYAASAAYWLASAAQHITTHDTGINGSIGVIRVHREYSQANAKDGITTTVLRAGEYKALANQDEPLTDVAKAEISKMLGAVYNMFISDVANGRGTSTVNVDQNMAQGKEFLGQQAKDVGLVDEIGTLESALSKASQFKPATSKVSSFVTASVENVGITADNTAVSIKSGTDMKHNLTKEQLEAIASGVTLAEVTGGVVEASAATVDPVPSSEVSATAQPSPELEQVRAELEQAKAATVQAQAATASAIQDVGAFRAIVESTIKQMNITLNRSADTSAMSNTEVLAAYATTKATLSETFKVGRVSAAASPESAEDAAVKAQAERANQAFMLHARSIKPF